MEGKKIYWWYEGLLFFQVGYNYSISGEKIVLARFWKWSKNARKKARRLAGYMVKNYECVGK